VPERTAQQELIAEAQTTGLVTRGTRQEAQSGSDRINEGQGGQKETSHPAEFVQILVSSEGSKWARVLRKWNLVIS
jgi:hypothetical protein